MISLLVFIILLSILESALASDIGKFLHITDIHIDSQYTVGSPATCFLGSTGLGCCRDYDIPISPYRKAGIWGDYNCDTPIDLVEGALSWLNRTNSDLDFILWTGDTPNHHDLDQSIDKNLNNIELVTSLFKKYLPNVRVFPCIGNHDTWPIDQLGEPPLDDFLTDFLTKQWGEWIDDRDALSTLSYGGYYTLEFSPNYRLIAINSLYYDNNNILGSPTNLTANQWEWFIHTLNNSRANNSKVWIIGHIYPGSEEAQTWFDIQYNQIVNEYSDIIQAQFWGHSHCDQFFFNRNSQSITNMGYVTPSVMPDSQQSSLRIFLYNRTSMEILDLINYVANITELNENPSVTISNLNYTFYYSALDSYDMPDLGLNSWIDLLEEFKINETMFNLYATRYYPDLPHGNCTDVCRLNLLCAIQYVVPDDYDSCMKV